MARPAPLRACRSPARHHRLASSRRDRLPVRGLLRGTTMLGHKLGRAVQDSGRGSALRFVLASCTLRPSHANCERPLKTSLSRRGLLRLMPRVHSIARDRDISEHGESSCAVPVAHGKATFVQLAGSGAGADSIREIEPPFGKIQQPAAVLRRAGSLGKSQRVRRIGGVLFVFTHGPTPAYSPYQPAWAKTKTRPINSSN